MKTIEQILNERLICTCDEAYKSRGLTDPTCSKCDLFTEIVDMVEEYEAQFEQPNKLNG